MRRKQQHPVQKRRGRGPAKFKRTDAARAIRAALDARLPVSRVEVDPHSGVISVIVGQPGEATTTTENPWDADAPNQKRPA
jgi:hypothetical protein